MIALQFNKNAQRSNTSNKVLCEHFRICTVKGIEDSLFMQGKFLSSAASWLRQLWTNYHSPVFKSGSWTCLCWIMVMDKDQQVGRLITFTTFSQKAAPQVTSAMAFLMQLNQKTRNPLFTLTDVCNLHQFYFCPAEWMPKETTDCSPCGGTTLRWYREWWDYLGGRFLIFYPTLCSWISGLHD